MKHNELIDSKKQAQQHARRTFRLMRLIVPPCVLVGFFAVRFMVDTLHLGFAVSTIIVAAGVGIGIVLIAKQLGLGRFAKDK